MSKRIRIASPQHGTACLAELFEDRAPRTCAGIWNALPFEGELLHAIWSGPETYLLIDPSVAIEPEHQTMYPIAGEIGYYHVEPGKLVDWPDGITEIAFFYGRGARPSMPDGPIAMNIFGRVVENLDGLARLSVAIRREGVKRLRVERA